MKLDEDVVRSMWLGERIYALFEDDNHLFDQAMNFAENRVKYNKLSKEKQESSISSELSELLY